MIRFYVDEKEFYRYSQSLAELADSGIDRAIATGLERGLYIIHQNLPPYPPVREGQKYVRTGTLGRSITTEVEAQGTTFIGRIGTAINYAPYVIGDDSQQAWMHAGRWWQLSQEAGRDVGQIVGEIQDAFNDELQKAKL
jgi:hypothetical protein